MIRCLVLAILTAANLVLIILSICDWRRLYLTDHALQIVLLTHRLCIPLKCIRELLFRIHQSGQVYFYIKTDHCIYCLGTLKCLRFRRHVLAQLAAAVGMTWENTAKYFAAPEQQTADN